MWADLEYDRGVGDLFKSVGRYFIVVDNEEAIRTLDTLSFALCVPSYPLVEADHLIGVGRVTGGGVLGAFEELAIIHESDRLFIEYWQSHGTGAGCVCPGAVRNGRIRNLWGWRRRGEDGA